MGGAARFYFVMIGLAIFLTVGLLASWFQDIFGRFSGPAFWIIVIGLIIAWIISSVRSMAGSKRDAEAIIDDARNKIDGPCEQWFDGQDQWDHADNIPMSKAPKLVAASYNGIDRIALLLREGFSDIVKNDLVCVFGRERAILIYRQLVEMAKPSENTFSLLGFLVGIKIGQEL